MNAIITVPLITGLGDIFTGLYWTWHRQEELKGLGYTVKIYFQCSSSGYTTIKSEDDCGYITKIFDFSIFDDWKFILDLDTNIGNFSSSEDYKLVNNYLNSVRCYFEKNNPLDNISLKEFGSMHLLETTKKNFFTEDVHNYCQKKLLEFPDDFILIHFRQHEKSNIVDSFRENEKIIDDFVSNYENEKIVFISSSEKTKNLVREKNYTNVVFNRYVQKDIYITNLEGEELLDYVKNTIVDMYLVSKAKKILRLGVGWHSSFLNFGAINNETSISNYERFI